MISNEIKNYILQQMKLVKDELRAEIRENSNTHSSIEEETNINVGDNTDAILELAEIIGG